MSDKASVIKEVQKYLAKGQIDKAIIEWEKLIKEYPDGNTYNALGDLYLKKGDKKNALNSFREAAKFFKKEGFSHKALGLYKKILNINPADADSLISLAEISEERGLKIDAIKYYFAAADSLSKEGLKERLFTIYDKILNISPSNIPFRTKIAEIYIKEGLKLEAAKEFLKIAEIFEEKGDTEKSIEFYRKSLDIQPGYKDAILGINHILEKTGDLQKAIEHIKEASSILPQDTDIQIRCAEIHFLAGILDKAKEYIQEVTKLEPSNIKAIRLLGEIYIKDGQKEKAWMEYFPFLNEILLDMETDEAIKILESFKDIDKIETGKRLITLYRQVGDTSKVINELISLGDIYNAEDKQKEALECFKEALLLDPDNESIKTKVIELEKISVIEQVFNIEDEKVEVPASKDVISSVLPEGPLIEDYIEELTEADFYAHQGLIDEAREILERLQKLFPVNEEIKKKLVALSQDIEHLEEETATTETEDIEPEVLTEPAFDSDVLSIFNEFKKGIEKEVERENHETHYNLGLAYKEMGFLDDAIREFQLACDDPKSFISSSSMLSICYIEKGLYPLAIDILKKAIEKIEVKDEPYWAMKYDLAEAYEKNGNLKDALDSYKEIYGWNPKFRNVSEKMTMINSILNEQTEKGEIKTKKDRISYL